MTTLLLGGSGMVGRNIQEHQKYKDFSFLSPTRNELDLFKKKQLMDYMQDNKVDTVINAAGHVGGIQENMDHPYEFLHNNLSIGMNLASAVMEMNIPRVLNLASSCMYPKNMNKPINEDCLLTDKLEETNEGYALAKIVTMKYFEYISRIRSVSYKTLIPCNLYGRYDHFDPTRSHLIAAIILKMIHSKEGEPVEIWGDGTVRREFMDAFDLADAIFFCLENYNRLPDILNIGTGMDYTIKEYYESVARVMRRECRFVFNKDRPMGMRRKLLDISKIKSLGWKSRISLLEGIKRACDYYKESIL